MVKHILFTAEIFTCNIYINLSTLATFSGATFSGYVSKCIQYSRSSSNATTIIKTKKTKHFPVMLYFKIYLILVFKNLKVKTCNNLFHTNNISDKNLQKRRNFL